MGVRIEHRGEDGAPFPVTFASEADAALVWRLEQEHAVGPASPMARALMRAGRPGGERAYAEAGMPYPSMWREGPDANGYSYFLEGFPEGDELSAMFTGCGELVARYGSTLAVWTDFSLPLVRAACDRLRAADGDADLVELAEVHDYAQHHTMVTAYITFNDLQLVTQVCREVVEDLELVVYELSQGYANTTVSADDHLWSIAQEAYADPARRAAIESDDPGDALEALRQDTDHATFFAALDEFLEVYGRRAETWVIDAPTWREGTDGFWAQLRQLARPDVERPTEALRRASARREALTADIAARLAEDQRDRFRRRVERLSSFVPVREERALWQLIATGDLRHAVLRQGTRLVEDGVIDAADDVRFLELAEVSDPPADARDRVAERRAEHERWSACRAPLHVGGVAAPRTSPEPGSRVLSGTAASRGVARGPARVIVDLADADRLETGDVLVCRMTSPPWTPLFGVASAVVTDSGELGSHPAIAAREYGVPCVVGATGATDRIPDGTLVEVDGTRGEVRLLD
jgi:pyruvate,water dikinase